MLKKEIDLLKTELSEKVSCLGKQGALIAAGGVVALVGAIFCLIGVATLIAFALHQAGLSVGMSIWISFLVFGLAIAGTGLFLLKSGLAALKQTSIAPTETIATVKEIAQRDVSAAGIVASADIKSEKGDKTRKARAEAEEKIGKVASGFEEIQARMTPKYMWSAACTAAKRRPRMTASIAGAVVSLGYLALRHHRKASDGDGHLELVID